MRYWTKCLLSARAWRVPFTRKHQWVLICSCAAVCSVVIGAQAANLYRYKDENGRWVMTDKRPQNTTAFEEKKLLFTERGNQVTVVNRGTKQRPILYALNQTAGPAEVWLEFTRQENLRLSQPGPHHWVVPGFAEQFVLQLEAELPGRSWSYEWAYFYVPGAPLDIGQLGQIELGLPFRGGPFPITQAFMGEASHKQQPESHFALDITMPERTAIVSARAGLVMEAERNFSRAGWDVEYADEANYVRVLHEDGTMAVYAHLDANGIEVVPGQRVGLGHLLGYSGNTGFSTGPHLHFVLQINQGKKLTSVPFVFRGSPTEPQVGEYLRARP